LAPTGSGVVVVAATDGVGLDVALPVVDDECTWARNGSFHVNREK
jgi:hypothetical protein